MMKRWLSMVVVVSLLAGAGARDVQAGIITLFNNLSKTPFDPPQDTNNVILSQQFKTDSQAYTLKTVTLWMRQDSEGGSATLSIFSDSGGVKPNAPLATLLQTTFTSVGIIGSNEFTATGVSLAASTSYWAVLSSSLGNFSWSYTKDPDTTGTGVGFSARNALFFGIGPDWTESAVEPFQMQVDAEPQGAAVPEPSTFFLCGGIMLGALAYRRKRMSRNVHAAT